MVYVAKLIGEEDGYAVERQFQDRDAAVQWAQGAGLSEYQDQSARGEVWREGDLVWSKSRLQTEEHRERNARRDATRFLAKLNLSDKGKR